VRLRGESEAHMTWSQKIRATPGSPSPMHPFERRARRDATKPIQASPGVRALRDRTDVEGALCRALRSEIETAQRGDARIARYQRTATRGGETLDRQTPVQDRGW
jgi:hypothetical protein